MTEFASLVRLLERSAERAPEAEAVIQGPRRITYGHLCHNVAAFSGFLQAEGLRPGECVALLLENSLEYVEAYYGVLAAGGIAVGLNSGARAREITRWLDHCGAKWVIADPRHPDFAQLADHRPETLRIVTVSEAPHPGTFAWADALTAAAAPSVPITGASPAAIIYTSGTTGQPKGVCLTHGNFSANTAAIISYLRLDARDCVLNLLPFFYSYGGSVLHTHLAAGGRLILENRLVYPQRILERISQEQVTGFPGVPSTFALLLQCADLAPARSLRYMTQAGGPMPAVNIQRICEQLPAVEFFVMYGQTEATARLSYVPPARLAEKLGSVGIPVPGVQIEVQSEDGRALDHGQTGEVCVRGPSVMTGYFEDPETTARVLRGGWLHTGDLGHLDSEGYLYLQGRRSDMIKSGAHRISPQDIEEVIATLPEVFEVAVVGVPDDILGEAIKAVVALRPGTTLDAMSVQRHCMQQLPRYKVPKTVQFADSLPRTSSGKIMRYRLTETDSDYDHTARTA